MTWLTGVALLAVVVALAFTGQLLPWNQSGYWAASVGVEIASAVPGVGRAIRTLILGGPSPGALTLTRFYALHLVLLPLVLGLLVAGHLYLLRRHGPARRAADASAPMVPFAPGQLARDLAVISLSLAVLVAVSVAAGGPDSTPADPSDTGYVPEPEWYFQSHYQVLRMMPGSLRIVATVVLPATIAVLAVALPWLDRGRSARLRDRKPVVAAGLVVLASIAGLTAYGLAGSNRRPVRTSPAAATYDMVSIAQREECRECHVIGLEGGDEGPDLSGVGLRLQEAYLRRFLRDPGAFYPDIEMPAPKVTQQELDELIAYLMSLRDR
jgi:ubiquinol-cytochrome c reductase cytochrome b subunit